MAVFPQPGDPNTKTLAGNMLVGGTDPGLVFTLSRDNELDVREFGDNGQKSPSDETILFVLRDLIESLLRTITPFEFISNVLTVYVSISGSMFNPNNVRLICGLRKAFRVGILLVLGRISSLRNLSKFFSFGFLNDDALFRIIGRRFKLLVAPNKGLGHLQTTGLPSSLLGMRNIT